MIEDGRDDEIWPERNAKRRPRLVLAGLVIVGVAIAAAACSDAGDPVESGPGPMAQPTETSAAESTPTTMTTSSAGPTTSEFLMVKGGTVDIPPGESGKLTIVLTGRPHSALVPVVIRNRTTETLASIEVSGTARGANDALIASGSSQGFAPAHVKPGEWAFGYVFFGLDDLPGDAKFDLTAKGDPLSSIERSFGSVDLKVQEAQPTVGQLGNTIVGIVANPSAKSVSGPVSIWLACFSGNTPTLAHRSYGDSDSVAANGTASFTVDLFGTECPVFALGASGHAS